MGKLAQQLGGQSQVKVMKKGGLVTAAKKNEKPATCKCAGGMIKGKK